MPAQRSLTTQVAVSLGSSLVKTGIRIPLEEFVRRYGELSYLRDMLRRLRVNVVIDVGANEGWYAKRLRRIGFEGYIFSFDPIQSNVEEISKKSGLDDKWHAFNCALGAQNGKQTFNVIRARGVETALSSFLRPKNFSEAIGVDDLTVSEEAVEVLRLDEVLPPLLETIDSPRVFLKTDTQGFDLEVVKGADGIMSQVAGLQSEISVEPIYECMPHFTDALNFYEGLGFADMNLFVVNRNSYGGVLEYDCIMARPNELDSEPNRVLTAADDA